MKVTETPAGTLARDLGDARHAPVPLVTPERKALYEAILEQAAAREGLSSRPESAGGSR